MKANLLVRFFHPVLVLVGLMAGCGGDKDKGDDNGTGAVADKSGHAEVAKPGPAGVAPTQIELASFIKDKRLFVLEPKLENVRGKGVPSPSPKDDHHDHGPEGKGGHAPDHGKPDECDPHKPAAHAPKTDSHDSHGSHDSHSDPVPAGEKGDEIFFQFNADGSLQVGALDDHGEAVAFPAEGLTYTVKDLTVSVLSNGKVDGQIIFSSAEPKPGDAVTLADKSEGKITTQITKVAAAEPLKEMKFDSPPEPEAKGAPHKHK